MGGSSWQPVLPSRVKGKTVSCWLHFAACRLVALIVIVRDNRMDYSHFIQGFVLTGLFGLSGSMNIGLLATIDS